MSVDEEARMAWIALGLAEGVGARTRARLLEALGDAVAILRASPRELAACIGPERGRRLHRALRRTTPRRLEADAGDRGQQLLTPADAAWPAAAFAGMHEPPPWLFLRGTLPPPNGVGVAIVGTRGASHASLEQARSLGHDLAARGAWIISGLALGVDGAAHTGALAAPRGRTVAVLGSALDQVAPIEHAGLAANIADVGGLVSELPPGTPPSRWTFPRRNRLIAALAALVLVIEAPARSGALLTARFALEQGREVAVLPGSARGGRHRGGHALLKQGAAHLVEDVRDLEALLPALGTTAEVASGAPPDLPEGAPALLWRLLDLEEATPLDALCERTGLGPARLGPALVELELLERARQIPGVGWVRC